jgi:hypothetical protein
MSEIYAIPSILLLVLVGAVVIGLIFVVFRRSQRGASLDIASSDGKYSEGYWMGAGMGIGLAIGVAFGAALGLATGNIGFGVAVGPGMGVAIGVAIGTALEQKHKNEIRPLTAEERRTRAQLTIVALVALVFGVLAFLAIFLGRLLR